MLSIKSWALLRLAPALMKKELIDFSPCDCVTNALIKLLQPNIIMPYIIHLDNPNKVWYKDIFNNFVIKNKKYQIKYVSSLRFSKIISKNQLDSNNLYWNINNKNYYCVSKLQLIQDNQNNFEHLLD